MGKNKDKKKKGLGMEKTLAKTEKKQQKLLKKELEDLGEDDIEKIISQITEKEKELAQVKEDVLPEGKFPPRRGGATFNLLPERDELVLFGGDYFDGDKVYMYNDLHVYSIKKNQWTRIRAPKPPPPRTFHQAAIVSRSGGELWVFGGEFSSPSQSQFHHYNDLWMFSFGTRQWQKIQAPNGPSPRSGHRMVVLKKHLLVFGGYYDNLRNCRFYNDSYLFNLETNQWEEMKFSPIGLNELPSPRSACQLSVCSKNNSVVLYGGFSKEKQKKKDKEKGTIHTDMFVLTSELSKKTNQIEWCWKRAKQVGLKPSERISFSMITLHDDNALLFGGVFDQDGAEVDDEDDEDMSNSNFFNDLYKLDLANFKWTQINLRGKKEAKTKKPKAAASASAAVDEASSDEEEDEKKPEEPEVNINDIKLEMAKSEDDPFTLSFKPASETTVVNEDVVVVSQKAVDVFQPHARRSSYLQFHKGYLYLYGGKFEDINDREYTFNDMYALNVKRMDEWRIIYEDAEIMAEIKKAEAMSEYDDDEEDDDKESDEDESDEDMEIDAPAIEANETLEKYFERTKDVWMTQAETEFPDEKSKKILARMANELCNLFWTRFNNNNNSVTK